MIETFARHQGAVLETELCIVGAGPVGIALAREFVNGPIEALLLESGGESPDARSQELNRGVAAGVPLTGLMDGRARAFGGSSWLWFGQCAPFDTEALGERDWAEAPAWPLTAADLEGYFDSAARFFGIPARSFDEDAWSEFGIEPRAFDPDVIRFRVTEFARPVQTARAHRREFRRATAVTTLLAATVVELALAPSNNRVEEVTIENPHGHRARVRARWFVLCCGAIENARLLLVTGNLGRRLDSLGRFFQEHLRASIELDALDRRALQDQFAQFRRRGRRRLPRLILAPERQRAEGVLSAYANVGWDRPRALTDVVAAGVRRIHGLSSTTRSGQLSLVVNCEQPPRSESRITLADERDPLGLPRPVIDWRVGEAERLTMRAMAGAADEELSRLGLARVRKADWLDDPVAFVSHISESCHHLGTTRMASSPADGVVDPDCRVHGIDNLFVAGTSVFASSGAANPTFAAVALALRLADRLKREALG